MDQRWCEEQSDWPNETLGRRVASSMVAGSLSGWGNFLTWKTSVSRTFCEKMLRGEKIGKLMHGRDYIRNSNDGRRTTPAPGCRLDDDEDNDNDNTSVCVFPVDFAFMPVCFSSQLRRRWISALWSFRMHRDRSPDLNDIHLRAHSISLKISTLFLLFPTQSLPPNFYYFTTIAPRSPTRPPTHPPCFLFSAVSSRTVSRGLRYYYF